MGYALLPFALLMVLVGLRFEYSQLDSTVPGAGVAGQMDARAAVVAEQIEMYGPACGTAALAAPGLISAALLPSLPPGANVPPQANCMTTTNPSGGRLVYAYMPGVAGAAGNVISDTQSDAAWYSVSARGEATSLTGGAPITVPAVIPVGAIVDSIAVNP